MSKLGGFIGALLAIAIVFVFTEWLYVDWFSRNIGEGIGSAFVVAIGVGGWVAGSRIARRITAR